MREEIYRFKNNQKLEFGATVEVNINKLSKNQRKLLVIDSLKKLNDDLNLNLSYDTVAPSSTFTEIAEQKFNLAIAKSGSRKGLIGLFYQPDSSQGKDGIFISFIARHGLHIKRKRNKEFYFINHDLLPNNAEFERLKKELKSFYDKLTEFCQDDKNKSILETYYQDLNKFYLEKNKQDEHATQEINKKSSKNKRNKRSKLSRTEIEYNKNIKKIESIIWSKIHSEVHQISKILYSNIINLAKKL